MTNTTFYINYTKKKNRRWSARFLKLKLFSHCYYIGLCLISWFPLPFTPKQIQPKSINQIISESLKDNLAVGMCTYLIASNSEMIGQIISVSFMSEPWQNPFPRWISDSEKAVFNGKRKRRAGLFPWKH